MTKLAICHDKPDDLDVVELRLSEGTDGDADLFVRKPGANWRLLAWVTPDKQVWLTDPLPDGFTVGDNR